MNNGNSHHNGNGGFTNGLVIGIIIGVAIALLFSTKKGKKLLKVLTDEGLEKISGLEELLEDVIEEEVDESEDLEEELPSLDSSRGRPKAEPKKIVKKVPHHEEVKEVVVETTQPVESNGHASPVQKVTTTTRRFFRGIPRRS